LGLQTLGATSWTARPERLGLAARGDTVTDAAALHGTITKFTYLGREAHVQVNTPAGHIVVQIPTPGMTRTREPGEGVALVVTRQSLMAVGATNARIGG